MPADPSPVETPGHTCNRRLRTRVGPFGQGGKPAISYRPVFHRRGIGRINFGDENFWQSIWLVCGRNHAQNFTELAEVAGGNQCSICARVYLSFDIARNGAVSNIEVKQPSGIPSLDRSAMRALYASNPLTPLPPDTEAQR